MLGREGPNRFQLDQHPVKADEIGHIGLAQADALIVQRQYHLTAEWDVPPPEFDGQTLLIDRFEEA